VALNSRAKGKVGELSAVAALAELFGWSGRRTQQRTGWSDGNSPDIEIDQTPDLFWEIKRVERCNIPRALTIAVKQCGRRCPVIMHRPNRSPNGWMLTIRLTDLPRLCHAYTTATDSEAAAGSPLAAAAVPIADARHSPGG
jgi:hypothetical protein